MIPVAEELPERLEAVLAVVYLVFNEGYSATSGDSLTRADLSGEAIRLGRLLAELLPDPEAAGLLGLMLLHESRRVFASLVRLVRDFDLAEEALHEAFAAAVERWGRESVPDNPRTWLVSTGRFKAIDALRRRGAFAGRQREIAERFAEVAESNAARAGAEI